MSVEAASRQFVDTNVLVYAHDATAGDKHMLARQLVAELWSAGNGCLSIQVLQEFYVTVTRKVRYPLDLEVARQHVEDLGQWLAHSPTVKDVADAISALPLVDQALWETQSTLLVTLLDDRTNPLPSICPLLARYDELAPTRLQLQPPPGSAKPVRFVQCRAF